MNTSLSCINYIWTGLFANLKRLKGPKCPPNFAISSQMTMKLFSDDHEAFSFPNFAISSQMTMKLGKDIQWVEIFTN